MQGDKLDTRIREMLGGRRFDPPEGGWDRLFADWQQAASAPARRRVLPLLALAPVRAAALLLLAGTGLYLALHRRGAAPAPAASQPVMALSSTQKRSGSLLRQAPPPPAAEAPAVPATAYRGRSLAPEVTAAAPAAAVPLPAAAGGAAEPLDGDGAVAAIAAENQPPVGPKDRMLLPPAGDDLPELPQPGESGSRPAALRLAAQAGIGKVSVGDLQYQVGLVLQRNVSKKLYVEVATSFTATSVSLVESPADRPRFSDSYGAAPLENNFTTRYGRNVLALGLSPSVGYRIGSHVALGLGASLYRNVDPSLQLRNESEIAAAAFANNQVSRTAPLSKWDVGLNGSLRYKVGEKLAVSLQYRFGLTPYFRSAYNNVSNSGAGLGLSYQF